MDFDQLKGFYYTAKLRSFTAAAKKLYLTQPAISLKVKALENTVGEKLLERVSRKVRLTPAGKIIYKLAEDLLGKVDEIAQVVLDIKGLERGRLSIGASDTTSMYFLPTLLKDFQFAHPKIELEIRSVFSANVLEQVLDREVDLGIVTLPQGVGNIVVEPLFSQRLICLVSKRHRFCEFNAVRISDLVKEPLILLSKTSLTRKILDECFSRATNRLQVTLELSSFEIIKHYVAAELGVSVVPERAVDQLLPGLRTVPLRRKLTVDMGIIYRSDRVLSHPATVFLRMAREYFKSSGQSGSTASVRAKGAEPNKN